MRTRTGWRIGAGLPVLAPDAEPFRVLHISDLHLMPEQQRKQGWVAALAGVDPDLVGRNPFSFFDRERAYVQGGELPYDQLP